MSGTFSIIQLLTNVPSATTLLTKVIQRLSVTSPPNSIVQILLLPPLGHEPLASKPNAKILDNPVISISAQETCNAKELFKH